MSDQEGFAGWAIVELFGHKRLAGHVSSQVVAGGSLVRVDVPETQADRTPTTPAYSKLVGLAAIYAITPVTEEVARRAAREIERWNDPLPLQLPALAAAVGAAPTLHTDVDGDDEEDDPSIAVPAASLDYDGDDWDDDDDDDDDDGGAG